MARLDPAIRHAITPPSFEADQAHRSRLVDDLTQDIHRRLILIAAPAGYGKTTVLADFTAHSDVPIAWVRLSEADQDPARFARIVWASLSRRFRRLKKELDLDAHVGATPEALAGLIGEALTARVPEDFVLVIDDVHLINGAQGALDFLAGLIESGPDNMDALAAGREVPEIPLVRWIADDELRSYGAEDLALDLEELHAILEKRLEREVDKEEALALLEETGGWVTAVLLSDLVAGRQLTAVQGADQPLTYEYLASSVFEQQPEHVREFLLQSAVLPVMTAEACDIALERDDSERMLTDLLRRGLFVSVTGERPRSYEYHDLFRSFLLEHPDQDGDQLRQIRLRAAGYFVEHDQPEAAFDLYFASGEYDRARATAEEYLRSFYEAGRDHTLLSWVDKLSRQGRTSANLLRYAALVEGNRGNDDAAVNLLRQGRDLARESEDRLSEFWTWTSEIDILGAAGQELSWDNALTNLRRLSALIDDQEAKVAHLILEANYQAHRKGDMVCALEQFEQLLGTEAQNMNQFHRVMVLQEIALCRAYLGDIEGALKRLHTAYELAKSRNSRRRQVTCLNDLGDATHLMGEYVAASDYQSKCYKLAIELGSPDRVHLASLTLGEMNSDYGLNQVAVNYLERALDISLRLELGYWIPYTVARLSMAYRRAQSVEEAKKIWARFGVGEGQAYMRGLTELEHAAAFALHAPVRFEQSVRWIREVPNAHVRVRCYTLLALSFLSSDQAYKGQEYLTKALQIAEKNDLTQIVAGETNSYPILRDAIKVAKKEQPRVVAEIFRRLRRMAEFAGSKQVPKREGGIESSLTPVKALGGGESTVEARDDIYRLRPLHREILYYILYERDVSSQELRRQFWPEMIREKQIENMHTAVHAIRDAVGSDVIMTNSDGYAAGQGVSPDAAEFERAAKLALKLGPSSPEAPQVAREALEIFNGEFLPQFNSEWVLDRRRELNELYIRVAERYAQLDSDHRRTDGIEILEKAIRLDPHRESLQLAYLKLLAEEGRQHEVKMRAARYRRKLAEELQLTPSVAFERRYKNLVAHRDTSHPLTRSAS